MPKRPPPHHEKKEISAPTEESRPHHLKQEDLDALPLLLSAFQAKPLCAARGKASAHSSENLALTRVEVSLDEVGVTFPKGFVSWVDLEEIASEPRKVFAIGGDGIRALQVFSDTTGWVRTLCPTSGAPTVLVSGIPMHRIKETDPMRDTREKMKALGVQKGRVLDTATGLGYTAIAAARTAKEVLTIELDPAAIELARMNPYSQELFSRQNVEIVIGDAVDVVAELPSASFGAVIHDPPTTALGGDLYSEDFYRELRRVLTRGGKLFHYICDPESELGRRRWPGVMKRLSQAGFSRLERHATAYGVTAIAK